MRKSSKKIIEVSSLKENELVTSFAFEEKSSVNLRFMEKKLEDGMFFVICVQNLILVRLD